MAWLLYDGEGCNTPPVTVPAVVTPFLSLCGCGYAALCSAGRRRMAKKDLSPAVTAAHSLTRAGRNRPRRWHHAQVGDQRFGLPAPRPFLPRRASQPFSELWLSLDPRPASRFSTLMSSSNAGQ